MVIHRQKKPKNSPLGGPEGGLWGVPTQKLLPLGGLHLFSYKLHQVTRNLDGSTVRGVVHFLRPRVAPNFALFLLGLNMQIRDGFLVDEKCV